MADDPTTEPPVDPPAAPPTALTETELRSIVGEAVDSRFDSLSESLKGVQDFNPDAFRASVLEDITALFSTNQSTPLDEKNLLEKVGSMLDDKISRIPGTKAARKSGPLGRWLTG